MSGGQSKAPSGTVIFLFSDVVGSMRLWAADPDGMSASLRIHDEIFIETISKFEGHVFATAGDSFAVAFTRASLAVECAEAIQRSLREVDWGTWPALSVRIGLHLGEAEERDANYFGPAVNQEARVMAVAHGGQCLLTEGVRDAAGVAVTDLGSHTLRDIELPVHLSQLGDHDFPPLWSEAAGIVSLPSPRTSLVGRDEAVAKVRQLLVSHRLVTLTGVGGCGKTRLSIEVAHREIHAHPEGVWFVDLSSIADAVALPGAFAAALQLTLDAGAEPADEIAIYLAHRRALLVVDNCEHVVDEVAALLDLLLERSPRLSVLATSRESLDIEGEFSWKVPSLGTSDNAPAVRLFIERAEAAGAELSVTPDTTAVIREVVERLDGIPLAIELAAALTRGMEVTEIRDLLDDRFRLLSGGSRRRRQRQATLEGAVQWSYDLLSRDEQHMLQTLSVFQGGFSIPDVAAVASVSSHEARTLVEALTAKSLIDVTRDESGRVRHRLLETIRLFALAQMVERGGAEDTPDQHLDHFLRDPVCSSFEEWYSFDGVWRIGQEYENFRSAATWALEQGRTGSAQRLAATISGAAEVRGETQLVIDCLKLPADLEPRDRVFVNARLGYALNNRHLPGGDASLQVACDAGWGDPCDFLVGALTYRSIHCFVDRDFESGSQYLIDAQTISDREYGPNIRALAYMANAALLSSEFRFSEMLDFCTSWIANAPNFGYRHIYEALRAWALLRLGSVGEAEAAVANFSPIPPGSEWGAFNLIVRHAVMSHIEGPEQAARSLARVGGEAVARRPHMSSDVLQGFAYIARYRGDEDRAKEISGSTAPSAAGSPMAGWLRGASPGATVGAFEDVRDAYYASVSIAELRDLDAKHSRRLLTEEIERWS